MAYHNWISYITLNWGERPAILTVYRPCIQVRHLQVQWTHDPGRRPHAGLHLDCLIAAAMAIYYISIQSKFALLYEMKIHIATNDRDSFYVKLHNHSWSFELDLTWRFNMIISFPANIHLRFLGRECRYRFFLGDTNIETWRRLINKRK